MVKHPNADNIVQLTKIFNVSANFLLNDDINISSDYSYLQIDKMKDYSKRKTLK